jgi:hypothetical protein
MQLTHSARNRPVSTTREPDIKKKTGFQPFLAFKCNLYRYTSQPKNLAYMTRLGCFGHGSMLSLLQTLVGGCII